MPLDPDAYWSRPLEEMLALEPWDGGEPGFTARLDGFGGVTLGCAARAAARTCPGRAANALHARFLRPVPTDRPARLHVENVRDGRRIAHRRVRVQDGDRVCCEMSVSFAAPRPGPAYQETNLPAEAPDPDGLTSDAADWRREHGDEGPPDGPLEWRWVGVPWDLPPDGPEVPSRYLGWVRPRSPLPDAPELRAAALAFLADYHSHLPIARKLRAHFEPVGFASLDQAVWIHRDLPWDDWWLATSESDLADGGRALTRRSIHTRDGRLVATMVQEVLLPE